MDYRCPRCARKLLQSDAPIPVRVTVKCPRCVEVVEPVRNQEVMHRTYRCTECGRTQHVERPDHDRSYCVACGTSTLEPVADRNAPVATEAPETVPVG